MFMNDIIRKARACPKTGGSPERQPEWLLVSADDAAASSFAQRQKAFD